MLELDNDDVINIIIRNNIIKVCLIFIIFFVNFVVKKEEVEMFYLYEFWLKVVFLIFIDFVY